MTAWRPGSSPYRSRIPTAVVAVWLLGAALAAGSTVAAGELSPALERALDSAGPGETLQVVVLMDAFPERKRLLAEIAGMNRRDRRAHVVSSMRRLAEESQAPVRSAVLAFEREPQRPVRVLWGVNGLALEATAGEIERLADASGVRRVLHDHGTPRQGIDSSVGAAPRRGPTGGDASGPNPDAAVAGEVVALGAKQVWDELGYTGNGVVVAVIDTGIDRTHPDLGDHMWTNRGEVANNGLDDDANGYVDDTWGWDFCLDGNDPSAGDHGTQVAGQIAGDGTDGKVTGMAPDAEVMALGINCDTPSRAWEASDYAIAMGAHVISQSYSWWWTDQPDYEAFRRQTDVELAAGVLHVNSAGNSGLILAERPIPYNISAPAGSPPPWLHPGQPLAGGLSSILAVGNVSWNDDLIDPSSSHGPAAWEDIRANTDPDYPHVLPPEYLDYPYENGAWPGLVKPDLSAYGNGTTTTCPGGYYCGFSGTSSAAPHVAGTAALMLEANPEATPAELAEALLTTAEHRGEPGLNNRYGAGLVQAFAAVEAVESGVVYVAHELDDVEGGNGDLGLDPGETVRMLVTVESRTDAAIADLEVLLSSSTPGVTIHDGRALVASLPSGGSALVEPPGFSLGIDPSACATIVTFDLEFRYGTSVRRGSFTARVGDVEPVTLLEADFESPGGWTADPGATTRGAFVREDPIGVFVENTTTLANPEDDTTPDPGGVCWVTGNGELTGRKDENNNDVDDGTTTLTSPVFGAPFILDLGLSYDRWYFDDSSGGDSFVAEISNDDGGSWTTVEQLVNSSGGWGTQSADLLLLVAPTASMRLRFRVTDGGDDSAVEGAVDEVRVDGNRVVCQEHEPAPALAPNPVGSTLSLEPVAGHVELRWQAPAADAGHDAATLFRITRSPVAAGTFVEAGSATTTTWYDVDALSVPVDAFYLVTAENAGGAE